MRCIAVGFLLCVPSLAIGEEPRGRYDALLREYQAAEEAFNARYDAQNEQTDWVARYRDWPGWSFAPRFLKLAEEDPEDPAAVDALLWVVERAVNVGPRDRELVPHHRRALELLAQGGRIDDERIGAAYRYALAYASPPTEHFLRSVLERGRDRETQGLACLCLAKLLMSKAEIARRPWYEGEAKTPVRAYIAERIDPAYREYIRQADPRASEAEAETLLERARDEYGDVAHPRGAAVGTIADAARSYLYELRNLSVGKVAPEIAGEDIDGKPLKLSDFRGRVVALVFWASWCGPCMGQVPHERSLVERLAGKPFALIGINGDEDRDKARAAVERERMTWPSWWNGVPSGPITDTWNVQGWPTVYVLDEKGVIRYKQVREKALDEAVDALLKEMDAGH